MSLRINPTVSVIKSKGLAKVEHDKKVINDFDQMLDCFDCCSPDRNPSEGTSLRFATDSS